MFEVYAVAASVLLPTGIISFIYFLYSIKSNINNPILWTLTFESVSIIHLGTFYMCSAIILSRSSASNEVGLVNNIMDDLAIINDTSYGEIDGATFYNQNEELPSDQNNEIEDSRNNKNKATPSNFLQKYQHLVQASIKKKLPNSTREERSIYKRMFNYARDLTDEVIMDTVENQNCFLRNFFYQALLVYSFVTSALSLLNTCQICQRCSKEESHQTTIKTTKSDNPSESFGEKILDDVSDDSSRNAAPVGPLFDDDSIGGSTPNLEVFSVKNTSQAHLTTQQPASCLGPDLNLQQEEPMLIAGKCATMLALPIILIVILYFLMENSVGVNETESTNTQLSFLPNFNNTASGIQTANFVKSTNEEQVNDTRQIELNNILRNVYMAVNQFQEERQDSKMPTATGEYLYKSRVYNSSNSFECINNETKLKTFDFAVILLAFFAVIFYTKLTEAKLAKGTSSQNINKCTAAFLLLWAPGITEMVVSKFLTNREPNIFSTLLLLLGNTDILYSTKQNIGIYKMFGKRNAFINPTQK